MQKRRSVAGMGYGLSTRPAKGLVTEAVQSDGGCRSLRSRAWGGQQAGSLSGVELWAAEFVASCHSERKRTQESSMRFGGPTFPARFQDCVTNTMKWRDEVVVRNRSRRTRKGSICGAEMGENRMGTPPPVVHRQNGRFIPM